MKKHEFKALMACVSKDETRPQLQAPFFRDGKAYATDGHVLLALDSGEVPEGGLDPEKAKAFLKTWPNGHGSEIGPHGSLDNGMMGIAVDPEANTPDCNVVMDDAKTKAKDFKVGLAIEVLEKIVKVGKALDIKSITLRGALNGDTDEDSPTPHPISGLVASGYGWEFVAMPYRPDDD